MMRRFSYLCLSVMAAVFITCSEMVAAQDTEDLSQKPVPVGPLMQEGIHFQYAIYYLPSPSENPLAVLRQLLSKEADGPVLVGELPEKPPADPIVAVRTTENVQQDYTPPDIHFIKYFGHGLTGQQADRLQKSGFVIIMDFAHDKAHIWQGLRTANRIAEELARRTGGLLWDEENREIFTPDEWHKKRIESWTDGVPDISKYIVIHAYQSGEYVRAITLGMSKFGLPDVVVDEFSWSNNTSIGNLINLFCQAMAERAVIEKSGMYDLDIHKIQNHMVRDYYLNTLISKATGVARLALKKGIWEEGDPNNRLIEIVFDRYPGKDVHAKQTKMISTLFGLEDHVSQIKHSEELLEASRRAKEKLPMLRKQFAEGLEPGEYILVKAPFKTPEGGNEWMWIEVTEWSGNNIRGVLNNEPFYVPSLHSGQIVEIRQEDVFDYIRRHPDGTQEGNETGEIIKKMQESNRSG